jgi:hypothetical protein
LIFDAGIQENLFCKSSETIIIMVTLPMTKNAFLDKKEKYILSVATTAGVSYENVKIIRIDEVSTRSFRAVTGKLRFATHVNVHTSVLTAVGNHIYFNEKSVLNIYLNINGLPSAALIVQKSSISSVDVTTPPPAPLASDNTSNLPMPLIAGSAGGFFVLLAVIVCLVRQLRITRTFQAFPSQMNLTLC